MRIIVYRSRPAKPKRPPSTPTLMKRLNVPIGLRVRMREAEKQRKAAIQAKDMEALAVASKELQAASDELMRFLDLGRLDRREPLHDARHHG